MTALGGVELAFHLAPGLLPSSYRERFAMHGVELFHRGILEVTPIRGVPLPLVLEEHVGPPPADLKELGIAPAEDDYDTRRYPRVHLPADSRGFPNTEELEQAELVLIGDSFGVATGVKEPPGLQKMIVEATERTVFNLSIAGIGPLREEFLLDRMGFGLKPRCIVWFFYAGNDATLSIDPLIHEHFGRMSWADAYAERRAPSFFLPDLVRLAFEKKPQAALQTPLPGYPFRLKNGSMQPVWFLPDNLRQLAWTKETWNQNDGWRNAQEVLKRVRDKCTEKDVSLLLVYVPTKAEVYLPLVDAEAQMVFGNAQRRAPEPLASSAEDFLAACLARRHALEESFTAFCQREGIPLLSATPALEALARSGELGYLVADTHWQETGQATLLAGLVDALIELGVVDESRRID